MFCVSFSFPDFSFWVSWTQRLQCLYVLVINNFIWAWSAVIFISQETLGELPIAWQCKYKINYKYCTPGNWINDVVSLCLFAGTVRSWRQERLELVAWVFFLFLYSLTKWKWREFSTNSMEEYKLLVQLKILSYRANFCRWLFEIRIPVAVHTCQSNNINSFFRPNGVLKCCCDYYRINLLPPL